MEFIVNAKDYKGYKLRIFFFDAIGIRARGEGVGLVAFSEKFEITALEGRNVGRKMGTCGSYS